MKKKQKSYKDIQDGIQEHIERYDEDHEIPSIGGNPWTVNGKLPYEDQIKASITKSNKKNQ